MASRSQGKILVRLATARRYVRRMARSQIAPPSKERSAFSTPTQGWLVTMLALVVMVALACHRITPTFLSDTQAGALLRRSLSFDYNRAVIFPNYMDHGFVRRGLGGTLMHLLGQPADLWTPVLFHIASALFAAAVMIWMIRRLNGRIADRSVWLFTAIAVFSPQFFIAWAFDIARTDMVIAGLKGLAVLALLDRRNFLVAALIVIGLMVHEAGVITGLPLLAAVMLHRLINGEAKIGDYVAPAAVLIALAALVYWAPTRFAVSDIQIIREMKATLAPSQSRDGALYVFITGLRGVQTSMCWNQYLNPHYGITISLSVALLLMQGVMLGFRGRLQWALYLLATMPPFAFLSWVASDLGRWYMFSAFNGWALAVALQIDTGAAFLDTKARLRTGIILFVALLVMGPTRYTYPNLISKPLFLALGYPKMPDLEGWVERCDPTWKATIALPSDSTR